MKKIFLLLILCVCFIFSGCSNLGGVELMQNADGSVVESYYVPFPKAEILNWAQENYINPPEKISTILRHVKNDYDEYFSDLISEYKQNVDENNNYTQSEKEELKNGISFESNLLDDNILRGIDDYIVYQLNFSNSSCYKSFKNLTPELSENKVVINENNILTKTNRIQKDPLLDKMVESSLTLGKQLINKIEERMKNEIGTIRWNNLRNTLNFAECSNNFEYTYVVPTARLKSNADSIEKNDGYYYHTWKIPFDNLDENGDSIVKIEYWTTTANRWIWYVFSLTGAMVVICIVAIYGKIKNQKANKEIEAI